MSIDQIPWRKARKILRHAGKILKKAGHVPIDRKAMLKDSLRVGVRAFFRGGALGAAGLDPQMADTEDLYGFKPEIRDGVTVMVKEIPTLNINREQASYYFNLGSALTEYSKSFRTPDHSRTGTDDMPLIREAFRQIAEENACEYVAMLELASQLSLLRKSSVEYCRNVPDNLARIDLGIRKALSASV